MPRGLAHANIVEHVGGGNGTRPQHQLVLFGGQRILARRIDRPDRAERQRSGSDRKRDSGVLVCQLRVLHRRLGPDHRAVLVVVERRLGHLAGENASGAKRIDELAGHRGIGDDPAAEILDRHRTAEVARELVRECEQRLGAAIEVGIAARTLLAKQAAHERLEESPTDARGDPQDRQATRLCNGRDGLRTLVEALQADCGVAEVCGSRGECLQLGRVQVRTRRHDQQRACLLGELVDGVVKLGAEHQPVWVCGPKQRDRSGAELFDEFAQPKRLHGGLARKLSCRICCIHSHNLSNFYNILRRPAA